MHMSDLTPDQLKLLYLISKKSGTREDNGNIIWLKEISLLVLVFEGIRRGIFEKYDYAPSLVNFQGVKLHANVSQEYLQDIETLLQKGVVYKLKLNTKFYDNINAYAITPTTPRLISDMNEELKKQIDLMMKCPVCGTIIKVLMIEESSTLLCPECSYSKETNFFKLENIPYRSKAFFSGGGR